jgi:hypothetical protein
MTSRISYATSKIPRLRKTIATCPAVANRSRAGRVIHEEFCGSRACATAGSASIGTAGGTIGRSY